MRRAAARLLHIGLVLAVVSLVNFMLLELVPGNPAVAILGPDATPEQYRAVERELNLDDPLAQRYLAWVGSALHGDLGRTLVAPVGDVADLVASRFVVTLELTVLALVLALALAVPLAMWSAHRVDTRVDRAAGAVAYGVISTPSFLSALLLIFFMVFRVDLVRDLLLAAALAVAASAVYRTVRAVAEDLPADRPRTLLLGAAKVAAAVAVGVLLHQLWPAFPRQGFTRLTGLDVLGENLSSLFLPALTLGLIEAAIFYRILRSDMISALREDYVLAARAKGMSTTHIMVREVLRPSSFSLVTVAGVSLGRLFGGAVVVEAIFRLPGIGTLIVTGVNTKDFALVQGAVLVVALVYVLLNLLVDASYARLDPRIRRGRA